MAQRLSCPDCQTRLEFDDEDLGAEILCPVCQATISGARAGGVASPARSGRRFRASEALTQEQAERGATSMPRWRRSTRVEAPIEEPEVERGIPSKAESRARPQSDAKDRARRSQRSRRIVKAVEDPALAIGQRNARTAMQLAIAVIGLLFLTGFVAFALLIRGSQRMIEKARGEAAPGLTALSHEAMGQGRIRIRGQAPKEGMTITARGVRARSGDRGRFELLVSAEEGSSWITLELWDGPRCVDSRGIAVQWDAQPPSLDLEDLSFALDAPLAVSGHAWDAEGPVRVLVDGVEESVDAQGRFLIARPAYSRPTKLQVEAIDSSGNRAQLWLRSIDRPELNWLEWQGPEAEAFLNRPELRCRGRLSRSDAVLTMSLENDRGQSIESQTIELDAAGVFSVSLKLYQSPLRLHFRARSDRHPAGELEREVKVVIDERPPQLKIFGAPEDYKWTLQKDALFLQGHVEDENLAALTLDSKAVELRAGGLFSLSLKARGAAQSFELQARDRAGNITKLELRLEDPEAVEREAVVAEATKKRAEARADVRLEALRRAGGDEALAEAMDRARGWLRRHQESDGSWSVVDWHRCCGAPACPKDDRGDDRYQVGVTGLSLLAILGHESLGAPGPELDRAVAWLLRQQRDGGIGFDESQPETIYNHAVACLALAEYKLRGGALEKAVLEDAVRWTASAQNPGAGWKYGLRPGKSDSSVTCWMMQALIRAEAAGVTVPEDIWRGGRAWIEFAMDDEGRGGYSKKSGGSSYIPAIKGIYEELPTMTASLLALRLQLGDDRSQTQLKKAAAILAGKPPSWPAEESLGQCNEYYWYWGASAMRLADELYWRRFSRSLAQDLKARQQGSGCESGSWSPRGEWSLVSGRIGMTALCLMSLESFAGPARVRRLAAAGGGAESPAASKSAVELRVKSWLLRRAALRCGSCRGSREKTCYGCDGSGQRPVIVVGRGGGSRMETCSSCSGRGRLRCSGCKLRDDGLSNGRIADCERSYGKALPALASGRPAELQFDWLSDSRLRVRALLRRRGETSARLEASEWERNARGEWRVLSISP